MCERIVLKICVFKECCLHAVMKKSIDTGIRKSFILESHWKWETIHTGNYEMTNYKTLKYFIIYLSYVERSPRFTRAALWKDILPNKLKKLHFLYLYIWPAASPET